MTALGREGMGDTQCQLYMLPYYAGMSLVGVLDRWVPAERRWRDYPLRQCFLISLVDITAMVLNYSGNMLAGSAIFAVVYASVTIWAAVFSRFMLSRKLSWEQWGAIVLVFSGLALTALGASTAGAEVLLGTVLVVVGSVLHALTYALNEWVSVRSARTPPHVNCCVQGCIATCFFVAWQLVYTLPHWEDGIARPFDESGGAVGTVAGLFAAQAVANLVHAGTFYNLLSWVGCVTAGVLKGLQAVVVFVLAHLFFCGYKAENCFSPLKGVSLAVVVTGVTLYSVATRRSKA